MPILSLRELMDTFDETCRSRELQAAFIFVLFYFLQSTVYAIRAAWSWLQQASICMETHLRNAAAYHQVQFTHETDFALQRLQKIPLDCDDLLLVIQISWVGLSF